MEIVTFDMPDAVAQTTVEGVLDYWVQLPPGSKPIAHMDVSGTAVLGDLKAAVLEYDYDTRLLLSNGETAWTATDAVNITMTADATVYKVGTKSVKAAVGAGAAAGVSWYLNFAAAKDLSKYNRVAFWARSSVAASAGDLKFAFDDTAAVASPATLIDLPALVQDTWTYCVLDIPDPSLLTAILSMGIEYHVDLGACNVYIDDVRVLTEYGHQKEQLVVDDYFIGSQFFALSAAVAADEQKINRKLTVYYDSFATSPVAPVT